MAAGLRVWLLALGTALFMSLLLVAPAIADTAVLAQDDVEQGLTGTLRDGEREPVPGVTIVVNDLDGNEVGTAESDADGQWTVPVDEPGTYEVVLTFERAGELRMEVPVGYTTEPREEPAGEESE